MSGKLNGSANGVSHSPQLNSDKVESSIEITMR